MKNSRRFLVRITQYNLEGQMITHFNNNNIYKINYNTVGLSFISLLKSYRIGNSCNLVKRLNFL